MIVVLGWGFQFIVQDDATTVVKTKTNKPQCLSRRAWSPYICSYFLGFGVIHIGL
jgi:hypothetical protein